jgi:hypothetical protein
MALQPFWALASLQFPDLIYSQSVGLLEWVISSSQGLYRHFGREMADNFAQRPPWAWGSLTCSKFTTRVKQLKVPPGGLVPWIFSVLKNSTTSAGFEPTSWGGNATSRLRRPRDWIYLRIISINIRLLIVTASSHRCYCKGKKNIDIHRWLFY